MAIIKSGANHYNNPISFLHTVTKFVSLPVLYIYNIVTRYLCLFFILCFYGFEQILCSFVGDYQYFRGTFNFSLNGTLKKYVSLQCVYQSVRLHIIITEKTAVLTFTTMKSYFLSDVEWMQNFTI
jgi:hypothetical protein